MGVEPDNENCHPNLPNANSLNGGKQKLVFKNLTAQEEIRFSSSKRYKDHFLREEKECEEYSENDILYEICSNEQRPSKQATTINTSLSTLREESKIAQFNTEHLKTTIQGAPAVSIRQNKHAVSGDATERQFKNIDVKPKLAIKIK